MTTYRGRFAPSPTGPLHAGSLVAALASWLDAKAHGGQWWVRIEDIDTPRCIPGAAELILAQLAGCGLLPDEPPVYQSTRSPAYAQALERLRLHRAIYACACSRKAIEQHWTALGETKARHAEWPYPGTCSELKHSSHGRAQRLRCGTSAAPLNIDWHDRRLGTQTQNITTTIGDFVLKRADGLWAYQMAVVVDDAAQGITHVVRGEDLADNTPRQIHLQRQLGLPTPFYLHTPLVLDVHGDKLSKRSDATALQAGNVAVSQALDVLGVLCVLGASGVTSGSAQASNLTDLLSTAVNVWRDLHAVPR